MKILVMNCGSSSLKYQLIDMDNESVLAKGLCERIGIEGSVLTHTPAGGEKFKVEAPMPSHKEAIQMVMDALVDKDHGVIKSTDEISAVGHRVVHGGTYYSDSVVVDEKVGALVEADAAAAPAAETEKSGELLTYALVQLRPAGKTRRYLCYQARRSGFPWIITLLYLEGTATPEDLRSMFEKQ